MCEVTPPVSNHALSSSLRSTKWVAVGVVDVGLLYTSIGIEKHKWEVNEGRIECCMG